MANLGSSLAAQPTAPLTAPAAAPAQAGASAPTNTFDQLKAGWANFAQKLQSDPNLRMGLLSMGAHLMQPYRQGQQNAMGQLGQSLLSGAQTYDKGVTADQAKATQDALLKQKQQALDTAAAAAKSKAQLDAAEASYYARRPAGGAAKSSKVALLNEVRDSIMTTMGWDPNNAEQKAAATQMAQMRISHFQTPGQKESAKVIGTSALPGQTDAALGQLKGLDTQGQNMSDLKLADPKLYQDEMAKRAGNPGFGGVVPPGADTPPVGVIVHPLPTIAKDYANGIHKDSKGNRIMVKDGSYWELPPGK